MPEAVALSSVAAICCGANRTNHCLSWGRNNLLCFATCRAVAVYDPSDDVNSVVTTLTGHEEWVTCVRWISADASAAAMEEASGDWECGSWERELVSGSVDKSVIVWSRAAVGQHQYAACARLLGHTAPVCSVAAHTISFGDTLAGNRDAATLVASAAGDSTVRLWLRQRSNGSSFACHQTLSMGSGFALDVALGCHSALALPLVACGCEDSRIHLFAASCSVLDACSGSESYSRVHSLVGHEDWVRALSFVTESSGGDLLLASCSQDTFIRVWRIARQDACAAAAAPGTSAPSHSAAGHDDLLLKPRLQLFDVGLAGSSSSLSSSASIRFAVSVETVLSGHDGWVYGVHWQPGKWQLDAEAGASVGGGGGGGSVGGRTWTQPLRLLSASMDRTMIVWEPEPESGLWMEQMRVGDVGGNTLGLYGCQFSPCGRSIIAHGYQGGFIRWNFDVASGSWKAGTAVGGHFGAVQDVAWDPVGGEYLLSVSLDQTSRLFAPWVRRQGAAGKRESDQKPPPPRWYEMARPQVHGYDVQCLALLGRYRFASGADEKVVRVFEAPSNFLDNFSRLGGHDRAALVRQRDSESLATGSAVPEGASVPALGLSNKAVYQGKPAPDLYADRDLMPHEDEQYAEHSFRPLELTAPPTEDNLVQNTLWPEIQKLYGHGFEIFSLAASPDGTLLASACKATKGEYATVLVWDTATWKPLFSLSGHSLTVSQMAFSHGGTRLLSVSRDRTWCVHEFVTNGTTKDVLKVAATDKHTALHSRIIWSCAWSHDDRCFATASRDKRVILWLHKHSYGVSEPPYQPCLDVPELADAVTAVDFAPFLVAGGTRYLIAAGLESGHITLFTWMSGGGYQHCAELGSSLAHHLAVRRLAFRNCSGRAGVRSSAGDGGNSGTDTFDDRSLLQLASCSDDRAVKVYDLCVA